MARESTPSPAGFDELSFSNPERIGRDGFLGLRFERRFGKSVLTQCRFKLPLQALTPIELADGTSYLLLLNPTGGVLGGDFLLTRIVQEESTHICLSTPSATRVYRTLADPAVQEIDIRVGRGSSFEYLPDHVIPYRDSKFRQSLHIEMEGGSRAIVWDAFAAGRVAHGERWNFQEVDSKIEIFLSAKRIFLNRTRIHPAQLDPQRLGFAEGFDYVATLIVVADEFDRWKETLAEINAELGNLRNVHGGASPLPQSGCVVKLLARSAADLMSAQAALWGQARRIVLGLSPLDLRKY
jgi:urease accessory protein